MCRKTIYLIALILLMVMAGSASATTITWTDTPWLSGADEQGYAMLYGESELK